MGVFHEDETNSAVGFRICYNRNKSAIFIRFPGNDFSVGIYGAFTAGSQCQQAKKYQKFFHIIFPFHWKRNSSYSGIAQS